MTCFNFSKDIHHLASVALITVGAMLVFSCGSKVASPTISDPNKVPTQISYNHKIVSSKNGKRSYRFETPLLERYELATEPFMEFRKGVKIETFGDSSQVVESNLVADYAHFNEVTQIWEAQGNVVAQNVKEKRWLYTETLFWDQTKKIIYTHVNAKVIDGESVHYGKGFLADENFEQWSFNNTRGQIELITQDSTKTDSTATPTPQTNSINAEDDVSVPFHRLSKKSTAPVGSYEWQRDSIREARLAISREKLYRDRAEQDRLEALKQSSKPGSPPVRRR